jgi:hypothetical protein
MPEHWLFWVLLVGSAVWVLTRAIRKAAWMATPEAAKERQQQRESRHYEEQLKQEGRKERWERRKERRAKWAARFSWWPQWSGLIIGLSLLALAVGAAFLPYLVSR